MEIADPERGEAFVIDVERGQETTNRDGDMGICDVVKLEILETCDELPGIRSARPILVGNEAAQIRAGFDQPVFAEGDNQDGGDCWLEVLPPTVLLRN